MGTGPSPTATSVSPVRVGQLWQDMAPDMVARERMVRVVAVGGTHAECVVERDKHGATGRPTRPVSLKRFTTSAFKLIEEVVDDTDQVLHARFLAAMTGVQGRTPSPVEYATAALRVHKELAAEATKSQD
ncbi:DUF6354 family protein (plasmid) [Streptomyces nojiriensis]|uniref:DUF6354 family protein n=1 Tax=Streptomyces nojiriensis TaxID=66374 RepID=UPI002E17FAEC